jgi:hypothetical protein
VNNYPRAREFWHVFLFFVRLPFLAYMVAFGVGVFVYAFEAYANHGPAVRNALLCFLLTGSWVIYTGMILEMLPTPPPAQPEPQRVTHLPQMALKRIERLPNQHIVRGLQTEWDDMRLPFLMMAELKNNLRQYGKFSWRTRPKGMNDHQYQRVRAELFNKGWAEMHQGAARLTELGKAHLSPLVDTRQ